MGTAILKGLLRIRNRESKPTIRYTAWVQSATSVQRVRNELGDLQEQVEYLGCGDLLECLTLADVVILGIPPDQFESVMGITGMTDVLQSKMVISLLAGVSYNRLMEGLRAEPATDPRFSIFRVIPSIGAKNNDSVTLIAETRHAEQEQRLVTDWLFKQLGHVQWLPESIMDEATATGAACNALSIVALDAIVDASVAEGIPRPTAVKLAAASLRSASGLMLNGGMTPESLKESMSVPKGITINSILELERGHARSAISSAVQHAIQYTRAM